MPRLLVNSVEGAKLIPFAKGRLRALRAAGHKNITQRYEVQGQSIRVTINGAEETIQITDSSWDYRVWPTSVAHPAGVVRKNDKDVPPHAVMTLTSGEKGLRRKENIEIETGRHDWVSADFKKVITYNHGLPGRYATNGAYESTPGLKGIFRGGVRTQTEFGVKGVALTDTGLTKRVVYATYGFNDVGAIEIRLYYLDEGDRDEQGRPANVLIATWPTPSGTVVSQPTFFSGNGQKFVTLLETATEKVVGGIPTVVFSRPRYMVRGTVLPDGSGGLVAAFAASPLAETPELDESTGDDLRAGFSGDMRDDTVVVSETFTEAESPVSKIKYRATSSYVDKAYSIRTRRVQSVRVIGVDMSPEGAELLIEEVTEALSDSRENVDGSRDFVTVASVGTDIYGGPIDSFTTYGTLSLSQTVSSLARTTVSITANGEPFFQVDTRRVTHQFVETRFRTGDVSDLNLPTTVTTTSSSSQVHRTFSLRDLDARHHAVAAVIGEVTPQFSGGELRPYSVRLRLQVSDKTFEKTVFNGSVPRAPIGVEGELFRYRCIAVRRPGEFVACLSPDDRPHLDPKDYGPYSFFPFLDQYGGADRTPLFALRRKDKPISPSPDKFSLDDEPGFRLDPIHLL